MKKLNLIALLLFLAVAVALLLLKKERGRSLQDSVMSLFAPFIHVSADVQNKIDESVESVDPAKLLEQNEKLTVQVQGLKLHARNYDQLLEENARLRALLDYKEASGFKLTPARVVRRSVATWWNTIIIDKGALDGIGTDSPVIMDAAGGQAALVGKTGKLSAHMTEIILLTDERCSVSATVEGTRERGLLSGERGGVNLRPDLRLQYLTKDAIINIGSNVYSSGEGGVFPSGLLLGVIKRFENKDLFAEAAVEPKVNFEKIDHVFVIAMEAKREAPVPMAIPVKEAGQ